MLKKVYPIAILVSVAMIGVAWTTNFAQDSHGHQRWEYKYKKVTVVHFDEAKAGADVEGPDNFVKQLNVLGDDGWELVAMNKASEGFSSFGKNPDIAREFGFDCYFKRPK